MGTLTAGWDANGYTGKLANVDITTLGTVGGNPVFEGNPIFNGSPRSWARPPSAGGSTSPLPSRSG
jgi:hypothetical protein